jgi:hypothetical protein
MKMTQENETTQLESLTEPTIVSSEVYYANKDLSNDIFLSSLSLDDYLLAYDFFKIIFAFNSI